jgi:hypothetical protein
MWKRIIAATLMPMLVLMSISACGDELSPNYLNDARAGSTSLVRLTVLPNGNIVTAVANGQWSRNPLKLIVWKVGDDGQFTRLGDVKAGTVSLIDAVTLPNGNVVTAVKTGNNLVLISWRISNDGQITRLGTAKAGSVSLLQAGVLPNGNIVTAVVSGTALQLMTWNVSDDGMEIVSLGTYRKQVFWTPVKSLALAVHPDGKVMLSVRVEVPKESKVPPLGWQGLIVKLLAPDLDISFALLVWEISEDSRTITYLGGNSDRVRKISSLSDLPLVVLPNGIVVVAAIDFDPFGLRLCTWNIGS